MGDEIMTFDSLVKCYYKNEKKHHMEYEQRYNAPFAYHLDFSVKQYNHNISYDAFYYYTVEIVLLMEKIYKAYEEFLYVIHSVPPVILQQFSLLSILDEVKSTNDIEGVRSTRKQIRDIIDGVAPNNARFASVVNKYHSLLTDEEIEFKTCQDIRNFYDDFTHQEIIAENSTNELDGKIFRCSSVDIVSATGKTIHRGVMPEDKIIKDMSYALDMLHNDQIPFLIRISLFHYIFAYIHPFYDGNGRTDRFITSYFLAKHFNNIAALRLSVLMKKQSKKYYNLFSVADSEINCGDMTPFIMGFLQLILDTFNNTITLLNKKKDQIEVYKEKIKEIACQDNFLERLYFILLQAALFYGQGISMEKLVELLEKSKGTIKNRLDNIPKGHLIVTTNRRIKYYKLNLLMLK
ncbi:MAG: Fic family protein [Phascolarctobacterium sp.]|nr:Fic family protein [Phascolarctobacterium sp.]